VVKAVEANKGREVIGVQAALRCPLSLITRTIRNNTNQSRVRKSLISLTDKRSQYRNSGWCSVALFIGEISSKWYMLINRISTSDMTMLKSRLQVFQWATSDLLLSNTKNG